MFASIFTSIRKQPLLSIVDSNSQLHRDQAISGNLQPIQQLSAKDLLAVAGAPQVQNDPQQ